MHLRRRPRPHPRQQLQPVRRGLQHLQHRLEPGALQHPDPQPPTGDILDPADRNGGELLPRQLPPYDAQRVHDLGEHGGMLAQQPPRGPEQHPGVRAQRPDVLDAELSVSCHAPTLPDTRHRTGGRCEAGFPVRPGERSKWGKNPNRVATP
ncbi:hypothetical protein OIE66_05230 [Nonomuraea sp. NBC_01738]|uniref:hypothetical protein n=1 Tax=Nonomuraea sp. NBC_01738 TaxID=2976003 RepID=UPI002E143EBC|nr:hypothetical protein OIE66_05230 [Nonomuraea sp. NBC_01738]